MRQQRVARLSLFAQLILAAVAYCIARSAARADASAILALLHASDPDNKYLAAVPATFAQADVYLSAVRTDGKNEVIARLPMDANAIRDNIKQSIARITGIPHDEISDTASYRDDLGLDSLSMLEIAVDAEHCFHVKIPDERLGEIQNVNDAVRIVGEYLAVAAQA